MNGASSSWLLCCWRLAWWMGRGAVARSWLLVACIAIGVSARVCVGTFTGTVARALDEQARPLLGADLEIIANQELSAAQRQAITATLPHGGRALDQLGLVTMALAPRSGKAGAVDVRGVAPGYPLYGTLTVAGPGGQGPPARLFAAEPAVYVQRELLARLDAAVGETLKLGTVTFAIAGVLVEDPGLGANPFVLGPRVLVDAAKLPATGLVGDGARVRHLTMIATADARQGELVAQALRRRWDLPERAATGFGGRADDPSGITIRTARQSQDSLARVFERLGDYLGLVSLVALLLGGVGVAGVVRGYVAEQLESAAMLQVLGATVTRVLVIMLLQAAAAGIMGGMVGCLGGAALENVLVVALRDALPVAGHPVVDPAALAWGMSLALMVTVTFAALPLIEIRGLSPLGVLRGDGAPARSRLALMAWGAASACLFSVLAGIEARSFAVGGLLIAALLAGALLTAVIGNLGLRAIAAVRPRPFAVRHGLANLVRPGFRPLAALVTISLACLLFSSLAIYQESLSREIDEAAGGGLPSLFAIDIQADQRDEFRAFLKGEPGLGEVSMSPLVHARYRGRSRGGVRIEAGAAGASESERWARDREQNLSFREQPGADDRLLGGRWIDDHASTVEASLERRYAERLGATLGDVLEFDVQGVPVAATVTSIRAVRWASLRPNFFILLSPHALRDAPQTWVAALPALDAAQRARIQARLAERFPGVSTFDVSEAAARVAELVGRIGAAVRFIGAFTLAAGLAVLAGVAVSTARERRADGALLKVLGAGRRTLALSLFVEFAALGALSGVLGAGQAVPLAWALTSRFDLALSVPLPALSLLIAVVALASAGAGLIACRQVFSARPLAVLREA
jgi:putative ABC transport system permease protein